MPRSAKEANNPILLKVQSLQLSFRPAGVSLGGGGGPRPPLAPPPAYAPEEPFILGAERPSYSPQELSIIGSFIGGVPSQKETRVECLNLFFRHQHVVLFPLSLDD